MALMAQVDGKILITTIQTCCFKYICTKNILAVKRVWPSKKIAGKKSFEIKGGGQEMAVMVD